MPSCLAASDPSGDLTLWSPGIAFDPHGRGRAPGVVHVPDSTVTAAELADPARYALYSGQVLHAKPYLFFRPQAALNPEQAEFIFRHTTRDFPFDFGAGFAGYRGLVDGAATGPFVCRDSRIPLRRLRLLAAKTDWDPVQEGGTVRADFGLSALSAFSAVRLPVKKRGMVRTDFGQPQRTQRAQRA